MKKAIFLDRDGVLNNVNINNGKPFSPSSFKDFKLLPNVKSTIKKFKLLNYLCIVITNQPDISRGKISKNEVIKMNNFLKKQIEIDDLFVCYHDDDDKCECRKPKPGLLFFAKKKWGIDFEKSYLIGDREKDIFAGNLAGCKTIFIDNDYGEKKPSSQNFTITSLEQSLKIIK
tara:strand:+ start:174 stop:692 length:519 start_codon:yes stop_codon:yes gene_type:complete